MNKFEINEAVPLLQRLLTNLAGTIADRGVVGASARTAIGDTYANIAELINTGQIGYALDACFDLCRQAGATMQSMESVREAVDAETPTTLGATMLRDYAEQYALAQIGKIISAMTFTCRQDVDDLIVSLQAIFAEAEETAADSMAGMIYMGLIALQAAIVNHLVQTALPLPHLLGYQFATVMPSLVISQRLYGDASRYDEIRAENKIVHPAFCPPIGQALSE